MKCRTTASSYYDVLMTSIADTRAAVITISDRCARGEREDTSGTLVFERLRAAGADVVSHVTVPDDIDRIQNAVREAAEKAELLVTTGGTGIAFRDVTPEALRPLLDRELPGIAEAMRAAGLLSTPYAMLSRQVCGVVGHCLVLALPGSERAVGDCLDAVWSALPHALALLRGDAVTH